MANFGSLGVGPDKSRFQAKSVQVEYEQGKAAAGERGVTAVAPGTENRATSMDAIKAAWPRCGDAHKYLYTFANGQSLCTQGWRSEFYYHVIKGTLPPASLFAGTTAAAAIIDDGKSAAKSSKLLLPIAAVAAGIVLLLVIRRR